MEVVAQGQVWSGQDACLRGLVDCLGGMWSVTISCYIAKQRASIPMDKKVSFIINDLISMKFLP